nr:MAG TPA: hypothetical protein [Bacteriophage sp.]
MGFFIFSESEKKRLPISANKNRRWQDVES